MTPYERVRQSRELTAATFPLPSVLDCIRYAITELAEYDDALLRQERTGDKRNNDKAHDPRNELGQALYMLLSAAVQIKEDRNFTILTPVSRVVCYVNSLRLAADLLRSVAGNGHTWVIHDQIFGAYVEVARLANTHGWPVDVLIDDTCAAFEAKHAPAREVR